MLDPHRPGSAPLFVNPLQSRSRLGQALSVALVFLWEWWFHEPATPLAAALSALSLIAQIGTCVFPVPCCLAVTAIFVTTYVTGEVSGPSQLLGLGLAVGTLAFDIRLRWVLALSVPILGSLLYQSVFLPMQALHTAHSDVPVLAFLLYLVVFFGYSSRQRAEYINAKVEAEQAAELRRRVDVAQLMHDSVTGDLSNIARVTQRQIRVTDSEADREVWRTVNSRTMRVLDSVHAVIRQLSDDPMRDRDDAGASNGVGEEAEGEDFMPALRECVRQNVKRLKEADFEGKVRILDHAHYHRADDPDDVAERSASVLRLVDELFANIMRHGVPGPDSYQVSITTEDRQIEVVSVSHMPADGDGRDGMDADFAASLPGGSGLRFHREQIERLGGVLSADAEDGDWIVYARIPRFPRGE